MTQWGFLLLVVYVALGLSRLPRPKVGTVAAVVTTIVLCAVFASYGALR